VVSELIEWPFWSKGSGPRIVADRTRGLGLEAVRLSTDGERKLLEGKCPT